MIVFDVFKGDSNDLLKEVQHELYWKNVVAIYNAARSMLILADDILDTRLPIVEKARVIDRFDHRVLQDAHDIMAASYRHCCDDGKQQELFHPDMRERYRSKWCSWFKHELEVLVKYPRFVRSVIDCVVYSNSPIGYTAEHSVCEILISHYFMESWGFPDGYIRTYSLVDMQNNTESDAKDMNEPLIRIETDGFTIYPTSEKDSEGRWKLNDHWQKVLNNSTAISSNPSKKEKK